MTTLQSVDRSRMTVDDIFADLQAKIGDYTPVFELRLHVGANVSLVVRDGASFVPKDSDVLRHGDQLLVVTPQAVRDDTEKRLQSVSRGGRLAGW